MKDKKYKYYEDLIKEYLQLSGSALKPGEANDGYKIFLQIKKLEDRKTEVENEYDEIEKF